MNQPKTEDGGRIRCAKPGEKLRHETFEFARRHCLEIFEFGCRLFGVLGDRVRLMIASFGEVDHIS